MSDEILDANNASSAGTPGSAPGSGDNNPPKPGNEAAPAGGGDPSQTDPSGPQNTDVAGSGPSGDLDKSSREIIHLRRRAQAAEIEAARLKGLVDGAGIKVDGQPAPASTPVSGPSAPPVKPVIDDFDNFADYDAAMQRYTVDLAKHEIKTEYEASRAAERQQEVERGWNDRLRAGMDKYEDLVEVLNNPNFKQSPVVASLIKESESGVDVAYFLGTHPDIAFRLNMLPPHLAAKEFGKLEVTLAKPAVETPPARNLISQAPEPTPTVKPAGGVETDEQDLPVEDFIRRRNEQELARKLGKT